MAARARIHQQSELGRSSGGHAVELIGRATQNVGKLQQTQVLFGRRRRLSWVRGDAERCLDQLDPFNELAADVLAIGSPGADRITTALAQVLAAFANGGAPLPEAILKAFEGD